MINCHITKRDIVLLRRIEARKSILNFNDDEVITTSKFQMRFNNELKEKSPYFRRIEEWRNYEETRIGVISLDKSTKNIEDIQSEIKVKIDKNNNQHYVISRGNVVNNDTGYNINIGRRGLSETKSNIIRNARRKSYKDFSAIIDAVYIIPELIRWGIFLDTNTIKMKSSNSPDALFMHSLYSTFKHGNDLFIAKVAIEEIYNVDYQIRNMSLYNVSCIKTVPIRESGFDSYSTVQPFEQFGTKISISHLFKLVKTYDKNFYANFSK